MRLLYVPVIGPIKEVEIGDSELLDEAYKLLDCSCVENVYIFQCRYIMLIDESGKICDPQKPVNYRASPFYAGFPIDLIHGAALIGKFGFTENGPDIVGLSDSELASLKILIS